MQNLFCSELINKFFTLLEYLMHLNIKKDSNSILSCLGILNCKTVAASAPKENFSGKSLKRELFQISILHHIVKNILVVNKTIHFLDWPKIGVIFSEVFFDLAAALGPRCAKGLRWSWYIVCVWVFECACVCVCVRVCVCVCVWERERERERDV